MVWVTYTARMAGPPEVVLPPGADPAVLSRALHEAHDEFVSSGRAAQALRTLVTESWRRSLAGGLDPERDLPPITLHDDVLREIREHHPLATGMPVIRRLLVESAAEAGLLVAVSDAAGQLLWVEGSSDLRSRAESMHFVPGADWSEASAGTNAPGTALALDQPVQIFGAEHLSRLVTPWSCSAAPIHDPDTGAVLGVLDVTGGPEVVSPQSLGLVRATVAAVEAELRLERLQGIDVHRGPTTQGGRPKDRREEAQLRVLGVHAATLSTGTSTARLSLRHSEILMLLTDAGDGLTTAELGVRLSEREQAPVTIRAELSRLRPLVGELGLRSRPYRLGRTLRTDADDVRRLVRSGRLRAAVAAYRGPILPASNAPGVQDLRVALHDELRSALLAGSDADALLSFADTAHGRDDLEIWGRILQVLPASSPRYDQVEAHVDRLDERLG